MVRPIDITAERYGRLVAIRRIGSVDQQSHWECRCDCGEICIKGIDGLRQGRTRSCGCMYRESRPKPTHGHTVGRTASREYRSWSHAKARSHCPTDPKYPQYGGRGLSMCQEWRDSFAAFYRDMGPAPAGHTIDRIDNDGNYEPGNCRWATAAQQVRNRRVSVDIVHGGERYRAIGDAARAHGLSEGTVQQRLQKGWSDADALTIPKWGRKSGQVLRSDDRRLRANRG